jgi:hypothetical protein
VTTEHARHRRAGLLATGVLVLVTGCVAGSSAPADEVPALADTLASVDQAIADHSYQRARAHLEDLVDTTADAREAGDLEPEQADAVLAAAARLLSALPEPSPAEERANEEDKDQEKQQEERQKQLEEEQKEAEEEEKDDEEGGRNGDSSGNGPDDGEGD